MNMSFFLWHKRGSNLWSKQPQGSVSALAIGQIGILNTGVDIGSEFHHQCIHMCDFQFELLVTRLPRRAVLIPLTSEWCNIINMWKSFWFWKKVTRFSVEEADKWPVL